MDDSLHDCQTHSGSLEFVVPVQALENAKELIRMLHVETSAIVPDEVHHLAGFKLRSNLY
jgi:hypothetical protein